MKEIWKEVPGIEGLEVSSAGRVRRILTKTKKLNGYEVVGARVGKQNRLLYVHRLIAAAFLDSDLNDKNVFICHKDDNPSNNSSDNLFVGDAKANVVDMIEKGRECFGKNFAKLTKEQVEKIRQKREEGETITSLAKEFCVHKSTIFRICEHLTW